MSIEQSINTSAHVSARQCHRDLDRLAGDLEAIERARIERRLVERLPFAFLDPFLAKRLAASGSEEMILSARTNIVWERNFLRHISQDKAILEFGLPLACLPIQRLAFLASIGLNLSDHARDILFYACRRNEPDRLAFLLDAVGWDAFANWSSFSTLLRDCTPELADPLVDFLERVPDPSSSHAMRCLGVHGRQANFLDLPCKVLLVAFHADPAGLAEMKVPDFQRNSAAARLLKKLQSNHSRLPILAEAPTLRRALGLDEEKATALAG